MDSAVTYNDIAYNKCIADYRSRVEEFNRIIVRFNAIVKYQHRYAPNAQSRFSNVKTSHLTNISIARVVKSLDHDREINKLLAFLGADEQVLEEIEKELRSEEQLDLVLRGKNQLDFFVAMVMAFRSLSISGGYFSRKLTGVHINLTDNRLSELSQYAVTPPELDMFLFNHRPKTVY